MFDELTQYFFINILFFFISPIPAFCAADIATNEASSADTNEPTIQEITQKIVDMALLQGFLLFAVMFCSWAFGCYSATLVIVQKPLNLITLCGCSLIGTLASLMFSSFYKAFVTPSLFAALSAISILLFMCHYILKYALADIESLPLTSSRQIAVTSLSIFLGLVGLYICNKALVFLDMGYSFLALAAVISFVIPFFGVWLAFYILSGESHPAASMRVWITVWITVQLIIALTSPFLNNIILLFSVVFFLTSLMSYLSIANPETGQRMSVQETFIVAGISLSVTGITVFILWGTARWLGYSADIALFAVG